MKVFEILQSNIKPVSEAQLIERLKKFDWMYEFSEDAWQVVKGNREMELIENMVYQMWKSNPIRAVEIWYGNTPNPPADTSGVPSFIFRLQAQE